MTKPHVSNNSGNNEWYTPINYIESARLVMNEIDCDPASCDAAQKNVKAKQYYTAETNGLQHDWNGRVWMNPPYAGKLIKQFVSKLKCEVKIGNTTEFVVLVNNATETKWFQELLSISDVICVVETRIKFLDSIGVPANTPLQGQVFLYNGKNEDKFVSEFSKYGKCLTIIKGI